VTSSSRRNARKALTEWGTFKSGWSRVGGIRSFLTRRVKRWMVGGGAGKKNSSRGIARRFRSHLITPGIIFVGDPSGLLNVVDIKLPAALWTPSRLISIEKNKLRSMLFFTCSHDAVNFHQLSQRATFDSSTQQLWRCSRSVRGMPQNQSECGKLLGQWRRKDKDRVICRKVRSWFLETGCFDVSERLGSQSLFWACSLTRKNLWHKQ